MLLGGGDKTNNGACWEMPLSFFVTMQESKDGNEDDMVKKRWKDSLLFDYGGSNDCEVGRTRHDRWRMGERKKESESLLSQS